MCVCDTCFMAETGIESVYEPGWGETGPQTLEDSVMMEKPVGIYSLTKRTAKDCQKLLDRAGIEASPQGLILFAEKDKEQRSSQAEIAIKASIQELMLEESGFPKVKIKKDLHDGKGSYQISERSPFFSVSLTDPSTHTNFESGLTIPLKSILLCKQKGATDAEYNRATSLVLTNVNKILRIFDASFRIPEVGDTEKLLEV